MWNQKGLVVPTARYFTHLTGARDPDADDDEFSIAGFLRAMNSAIRRASRFLAIGAQRGLKRSGRLVAQPKTTMLRIHKRMS